MKTPKKMAISKMDAVKAQLETAIKLYFEDRDLISAYTLCAAADQILEDIWKHERDSILSRRIQRGQNVSHLMFSMCDEWKIRLEDEHRRKAFDAINATRNFLKHADKDHNLTHHYYPTEETGLRLFTACRNFRLVSEHKNMAVDTFLGWFLTINPHFLAQDNPLKHVIPENFTSELEHSELAVAGYQMLQKSCPELFPPHRY
ncbi:conserved hypothetical protein [Magnetospirillum sp. LM-5]|uniref:hypothetical protein n=1 Tax=Magnetospirillum sp. LM-5 TaxID=2681466 RepID=UPI00137E9098|nr:hypothetical protein [Magnetospirillum sp. LM-5]CAA7620856.1 conserved hypothetical protein [Magnetospirillum sp. LM-5]